MKIEKFDKTITTEEYVRDYVNVEEFLPYCKACENYEKLWSCPPYAFDPVRDYWEKFQWLYVMGRKIILEEDEKENWEAVMRSVKEQMSEELFVLEGIHPGSKSLSAGNCHLCEDVGCTRTTGQPCRFPEKMRYSIESLGGNVGLSASKLLGVPLQWIEEGKLPDYFVLIGGLLY